MRGEDRAKYVRAQRIKMVGISWQDGENKNSEDPIGVRSKGRPKTGGEMRY